MRDPQRASGPDRGDAVPILVVDDEQHLRDLIAQTLDAYQVSTVCNGREAIDRLKRESFALVITDLMMPCADGFAVLDAARHCDHPVQVLVLTGYPSAETERRCLDLGCSGFISKPFDVGSLRAQVDLCVQRLRDDRERSDDALSPPTSGR